MLSELIIQEHNKENGILGVIKSLQGFPGGLVVKKKKKKKPPEVQETWVQSLDREDP